VVDAVREKVALGSRVLGAAGHDDLIWGHLSVRDPEGRGVWMKGSGLGMDEVRTTDVILVSAAGEVLAGAGRPHIEYPIHTEVLAARPDVGAVVHTHAQHATALGASGEPLLAFSHAANLFIPPELVRYTETGDLIRTPEMGRSVARTLGQRDALLLVNHGIVTTGRDVSEAVMRAVLLEQACAMQLLVHGFGGSPSASDEAESLAKREHIYGGDALQQAFDHLVRRLDT
jgi:L-ribulose-5-phosphate 4-epimerase